MEAPMQQVYRDEEGGIGVHSLVSSSAAGTPRWAKQSSRRKYMGRIAVTSAALFGLYLLFCSWVAFSRRAEATTTPSLQEAGSAIVDTFDHPPQLPWPRPPKGPKHPPHHPPGHPPPPHHPPTPTVLACAALPTTSESVADTTTIDVTLPTRAKVVLSDWLLHGDLSVSRTDNQLTGNQVVSETNLTVSIKTIPAVPPGAPKALKVDLEEETDEDSDEKDDDDEEKSDLFVLCAITFGHPHPPPHPPRLFSRDSEVETEEPEEEEEKEPEVHPHPPHRRPHPPPAPVLISLFPALNETYPKFPKPPKHHPCHHKMMGDVSESATNLAPNSLKKAFRSTVSFLFPMLSVFPQPNHVHGHKPHHRHGRPMPPHFPHHPPPPPPPPPFWVIETDVTLPRFVPVDFGFHFPPPRPRFGWH